jgi:hypothetical protein
MAALVSADPLAPPQRRPQHRLGLALLHTAPLFPMRSPDGIVHRAVGLVDVVYSAIPHAPRLGYVFCLCGIVVCPIQQLQSLAEAPVGTHAYIDGRVIFEVLAVIDRGPLDLGDCGIDLTNRMFFVPLNGWPCNLVQIGARQTQIGKRVQVCRVRPWYLLG